MRVLSGVQPSGKLHIGNYFGMMKPAIELQEQGEAYLFIANYHAMTTVQDGAALREMTRDVALDFLACGIDPARTALYRQSDVLKYMSSRGCSRCSRRWGFWSVATRSRIRPLKGFQLHMGFLPIRY